MTTSSSPAPATALRRRDRPWPRLVLRTAAATVPAALLAVGALLPESVAARAAYVAAAAAWSLGACRWALRAAPERHRLLAAAAVGGALPAAYAVLAVAWPASAEFAALYALAAPQAVFAALTVRSAADLGTRTLAAPAAAVAGAAVAYAAGLSLVPVLYASGVGEEAVGMPVVTLGFVAGHLAAFTLCGLAGRWETPARS